MQDEGNLHSPRRKKRLSKLGRLSVDLLRHFGPSLKMFLLFAEVPDRRVRARRGIRCATAR